MLPVHGFTFCLRITLNSSLTRRVQDIRCHSTSSGTHHKNCTCMRRPQTNMPLQEQLQARASGVVLAQPNTINCLFPPCSSKRPCTHWWPSFLSSGGGQDTQLVMDWSQAVHGAFDQSVKTGAVDGQVSFPQPPFAPSSGGRQQPRRWMRLQAVHSACDATCSYFLPMATAWLSSACRHQKDRHLSMHIRAGCHALGIAELERPSMPWFRRLTAVALVITCQASVSSIHLLKL